MSTESVNLLEYADYRKYLADTYSYEKRKNPSFSFRAFAMRAKLGSPNYLKLVMDGSRRLTDKMLPHFVRGLRLTGPQADYFRHLVLHQETRDPETKSLHLSEMLKIRSKIAKKAETLATRSHEVLKHWLTWTLREMVLLDDFQVDPAWVSSRLRTKVSAEQIHESLKLLLDLGLVVRAEDGRYQVGAPLITTGDDLTSALLKNLHRQFIELGLQSLMNDPIHEREIAGLTLAISKARLVEFKEALREFRKDMNRRFSSEVDNDEVYQLCVSFFPLTKEGRTQ